MVLFFFFFISDATTTTKSIFSLTALSLSRCYVFFLPFLSITLNTQRKSSLRLQLLAVDGYREARHGDVLNRLCRLVCPYDHIWNLYTDLRYTEISSSKKKDRNGKQKTKNFIVIDRVKKSDGYLDDDGHFQFLLFKRK